VYGGAIGVLIPHSGEVGLLALLMLTVAPLAFIASINPSLSAATVTGVIVLLVPAMSHIDPLASAIDRVMEVTVGALTGLVASFLVLPSRAHRQIRNSAARLLDLIAAALSELMAGLSRGRDNDALHRIQDGIGAALVELNATGAEAERERAAHLSSGPNTGPLLRTILRLRHDAVMIGRASVVPLPPDLQAHLAAPLAAVSDALVTYLRAVASPRRPTIHGPDRRGGPGLCRANRLAPQQGLDARSARRRSGAPFRAGILAGADAPEHVGPSALRRGVVRRAAGGRR